MRLEVTVDADLVVDLVAHDVSTILETSNSVDDVAGISSSSMTGSTSGVAGVGVTSGIVR